MTGGGFGALPLGYVHERNLDDIETSFSSNRPLGRNIVPPSEKEKTSSVAKIKVVVCLSSF